MFCASVSCLVGVPLARRICMPTKGPVTVCPTYSMDRMLSCGKDRKCHAADIATVLPGACHLDGRLSGSRCILWILLRRFQMGGQCLVRSMPCLPQYVHNNSGLASYLAVQSIKAVSYDRDSGLPDADSCRTVFALASAGGEDAGGEDAGVADRAAGGNSCHGQATRMEARDGVNSVEVNDAAGTAAGGPACTRDSKSLPAKGELGGLALDSEGYIWVPLDASCCGPPESLGNSRQPSCTPSSWILRVDAATGRLDRCISLDASDACRPTACAFGGDELDVLYVTTRYMRLAWKCGQLCLKLQSRHQAAALQQGASVGPGASHPPRPAGSGRATVARRPAQKSQSYLPSVCPRPLADTIAGRINRSGNQACRATARSDAGAAEGGYSKLGAHDLLRSRLTGRHTCGRVLVCIVRHVGGKRDDDKSGGRLVRRAIWSRAV